MNDLPKRKNIRLKGYDYSQSGRYFITICTKNRAMLFGEIIDGKMRLNDYGKFVENELLITSEKRPYVLIDNYVIMPNHIHILILLKDTDTTDTARRVPTKEQFGQPTKKSIPAIIRSFKSASTNTIRKYVGTRRAVSDNTSDFYVMWQSRYHDHIIRNEESYQKIYTYIKNNPIQWELDCHNPINPKYKNWDENYE